MKYASAGIKLFLSPKFMLGYGFIGLMLSIDGLLYTVVSYLFRLFNILATNQLLSNEVYQAISSRIYLFVGIVALFTFSIALLKALVNPEELNKTPIKSFKAMVTSIILIVLLPTIFNYVFLFQEAIISDGTITHFFDIDLSNSKNGHDTSDTMEEICKDEEDDKFFCQSNYIVMSVFEAFFQVNDDTIQGLGSNEVINGILKSTGPLGSLLADKLSQNIATWKDAREFIIKTGNFTYISTFINAIYDADEDKAINYIFIISTVCGVFLAYIILSFCLDLGVRCAKLAFYQIIAPIPIFFRMIPGKEDAFNKWIKQTVSCFLEVLVRLLIINFVYFIADNLFIILREVVGGLSGIYFIGKAILVLGLLSFAKQAPKLLQDALGLQGSGVQLGIKGKLHDIPIVGKGFDAAYSGANKLKGAATGAAGGAWTGLVNNVGLKSGALMGAAKGFKSGGSQLNKQRQGVYEAFGGEGDAGLFGGRAFFDAKANKAEKDAKKIFKEQFQNSEEYQQRYRQELPNQEVAKQNAIAAAQSAYNNAFDAKKFIDDSLREFKKTDLYKGWRDSAFAQQKVNSMIAQGKLNGSDPQAIRAAVENIENEHVSNMAKKFIASGQDKDGKVMQYMKNIDASMEANAKLSKAQKSLDAARNIDIEKAAKESVNEFYRTAESKELSFTGKAYQKEMEADYIKDYKKRHGEEIALYEEAFKNYNKSNDGKKGAAPIAPPPTDSKKE